MNGHVISTSAFSTDDDVTLVPSQTYGR